MSKYTVYKHVSPSGKVYIGITKQKPEARWGRDGSGYKHSPHLRAAIKKYGWETFQHEILADGLTQKEAETKEVELIAFYMSTDPRYGYNTDRGGSTGTKHTEETKRKIAEANRARVWSDSSRQKLREYKTAHPNPPEMAAKIGAANRGRKHRPDSIKKIQAAQVKRPVQSLTTGMVYGSVQAAAASCGTDPSHIVAVCRGRRKTAGGNRWIYAEGVIA